MSAVAEKVEVPQADADGAADGKPPVAALAGVDEPPICPSTGKPCLRIPSCVLVQPEITGHTYCRDWVEEQKRIGFEAQRQRQEQQP